MGEGRDGVLVRRGEEGFQDSFPFPLGEGRDGVLVRRSEEGFQNSFPFPLGEGRDGVLARRGEIDIKGKGMMKTYFLEKQ